eukprot:gnl/Hemi2/2462_TR872_c21_g1_i2.p1 gnl/Hemi2/2462_TR872_c21_g1~~gnl/Hemi2/2462_TR872_c21_g1_i2.p1  ORF type:complete len:815 (-),score=71.77 gnl/Hemi2/2462_TR872_c21_g1_i2:63-2330(-)
MQLNDSPINKADASPGSPAPGPVEPPKVTPGTPSAPLVPTPSQSVSNSLHEEEPAASKHSRVQPSTTGKFTALRHRAWDELMRRKAAHDMASGSLYPSMPSRHASHSGSCPAECSGHGTCTDSVCVCDIGFVGQACQHQLMIEDRVYGDDPPTELNLDLLKNICMAAGLLTVLGSTTILVSFVRFEELRSFSNKLVTLLSVSDLGCGIVYMMVGGGATDSAEGCLFTAFLMQFFELSSVLWTGVLATHVYLALNHPHEKADRFLAVYHIICWVVPFAISMFLLLEGHFGWADNWCWIVPDSYHFRFMLFYIPLYAVFVFNVLMSLQSIRQAEDTLIYRGDQVEKADPLKQRFYLYLVAFILCWTPAIINRAHNIYDPVHPWAWLVLTHTVMSPLQGFFNALIFGWTQGLKNHWLGNAPSAGPQFPPELPESDGESAIEVPDLEKAQLTFLGGGDMVTKFNPSESEPLLQSLPSQPSVHLSSTGMGTPSSHSNSSNSWVRVEVGDAPPASQQSEAAPATESLQFHDETMGSLGQSQYEEPLGSLINDNHKTLSESARRLQQPVSSPIAAVAGGYTPASPTDYATAPPVQREPSYHSPQIPIDVLSSTVVLGSSLSSPRELEPSSPAQQHSYAYGSQGGKHDMSNYAYGSQAPSPPQAGAVPHFAYGSQAPSPPNTSQPAAVPHYAYGSQAPSPPGAQSNLPHYAYGSQAPATPSEIFDGSSASVAPMDASVEDQPETPVLASHVGKRKKNKKKSSS